MLTCYSGIVLLADFFAKQGTVRPDDAVRMTELTPTQRLEHLKCSVPATAKCVDGLLGRYEQFLENTDRPKPALVEQFMNDNFARERMDEAKGFGDGVFELLRTVASESTFYRFLVV